MPTPQPPVLEIELIARGLCVRDNRVLLCKSIKGNYFYLPGGHVEFGEPAATALAREFLEETGAFARVGTIALVHEHFFRQGPHLRHELNLVFHVELASTQVVSREKKLAFDWVPSRTLLSWTCARSRTRPGSLTRRKLVNHRSG